MKNGWMPLRDAPYFPDFVGTLENPSKRYVLFWMRSTFRRSLHPNGRYDYWPEGGKFYWTPGTGRKTCYPVPDHSRGSKVVAWQPIRKP